MIQRSEFDLLTAFASITATVGAFFLVRSILMSGRKTIAAMSGTYLGNNPHLEIALVQQKTDSTVGFSLTVVSGLFWITTVFYSYPVFSFWIGVGITVVALSALGIISHFISHVIYKSSLLSVRACSFAFHVEACLKPHIVERFDAEKLIEDAKRQGLSSLLNPDSDSHTNLATILHFAGASPGADQILELRNRRTGKT